MPNDANDQAFSRHLRQIGLATPEQVQAALDTQTRAASSGAPIPLSEALVRNGVITPAQRENLEQRLREHQSGPQKLGAYTMTRKLGEGGMGAVYLAQDAAHGRNVAVKVLSRQLGADAGFVKRFQREAAAAIRLKHPNIVGAFAAGEDQGYHYYVMEYCDGEPLSEILRRERMLPIRRALQLMVHAARGLQFAHQEGILHRDIKPANLMLAKSGAAKILDLGLAKRSDDVSASFKTVTGAVLGTPHYISPEQAQGAKDIDGRTDIYSLGATLYHLLTGKTPFEGASVLELLAKQIHTQLPNPQDLREEIPDDVVLVLRRMMAKNPADRYRDCAELLLDLEELAVGRTPKTSVLPPAGSVIAPRARRPGSRKRVAIAVVAVALAGLAAYFFAGGKTEAPPSVAAVAKPPKAPAPPETPDAQIRALMARLQQLNPDFDRKETHAVENGAVRTLEISSVGVSRIDPVSELRGLTGLNASGRWDEGEKRESFGSIRSLAPLNGLKLRSLVAHHNPFSDLSPLEGMKLESLDLTRTGVTDLSPLRGMPLRSLGISFTEIQDLSPLKGMPLKVLEFRSLRIGDLSPLYGLPLERLQGPLDPVRDAAWLSAIPTLKEVNGQPLNDFLGTSGTSISDDARWKKATELIPLVEPAKDRGVGSWTRQGEELVCDATSGAWLQLPYYPPVEYDVRVDFTRRNGDCETGVYFVHDRKTSVLLLSGWGNRISGLATVAGKHADENPTTRQLRLEDGHRYICVLQVRRDSVIVFLDGTERTRWTPAAGALGSRAEWRLPPFQLGLASCETVTTFHRVSVLEIEGKGRAGRERVSAPDAAFLQSIAGLGAAEQLERVLGKLEALHPLFDRSTVRSKTEGGSIVELSFPPRAGSDLWPLSALPGLRILNLQEPGESNTLVDLSGLRGMKLRELSLRGARVSDLSPLRGMPLQTLDLQETLVRDLSPLRGMPLVSIDCRNSPAIDFLPLREIRTLQRINGRPAAELLNAALPWKAWFDGKSIDGMKRVLGWKVENGAILKTAPEVSDFQTSTQISDGFLRIRFELKDVDSAHFSVRQGDSGGYDIAFNRDQAKALEGRPHVLIFECHAGLVTATLDEQPIAISEARPARSGWLQFNGKKGVIRILAIDFCENR